MSEAVIDQVADRLGRHNHASEKRTLPRTAMGGEVAVARGLTSCGPPPRVSRKSSELSWNLDACDLGWTITTWAFRGVGRRRSWLATA
jgi:hypothetical protein